MHPERDIQSVRFVGTLSAVLGMVLITLTILAALFALFSFSTINGSALRWVVGFFVALIMASTMMGCGTQLQRARYFGWSDVENIRMIWTSLIIVMTLGTIISLYFVPPLAYVGGFMLFLLFTIRGAIIRLTRRF